jgi:UDP-glucose 4-epimerase
VNNDSEGVYQDKHILITGGLGFIGSTLARRLVKLGAEVCLIDNLAPELGGNLFNIHGLEDRVKLVIADMRDKDRIHMMLDKQDYLFNLAGQGSHIGSMQDPETDLSINTSASLQTLELCRKHNPNIRIIYTSTRQVYGHPQSLPVDEMHPLTPLDFNGVSKLAGSLYHIVASRVYGLQTSVLRLTNVYGPRMRVKDARLTFIGWWFRQLLENQPLEIFGDGKQVRDFNYVDDVVDALLFTAATPETVGQVYNLGADDPISLLELARKLIALNGGGKYRLVDFPPDRQPIDIGNYTGDYGKFHSQLGWRPTVPLDEGLARTLDYYREYKAHYW